MTRRRRIKYKSLGSLSGKTYKTRRGSKIKKKSKKLLGSKYKSKQKKEKVEKVVWTSLGFVGVMGMVLAIVFLVYLQQLTKELPALDNPFEGTANSVIYDRNGMVLYEFSSEDGRRNLIKEGEYVPETMKWTFLAAEDEEFFEHKGVDFTALTRCVFYKLTGGPVCGGSTLTQQVIINTVIEREHSYKRKIKDIILALQLERLYGKDEILNIYMNVVPQGSGVRGVKTGANFYFKKDIKDLTIAEMAVLSAIVQQPSRMSPTVGTDLDGNKERLKYRTDYILDQMIDNVDRINKRIEEANEINKEKFGENYIEQKEVTVEELKNSKEEVSALEYQKTQVEIKAPHFVWYVNKLLQERGYNNGEPFTETQIQTLGLKVETTLDYSLQEIAEKYVASSEPGHAGYYRNIYGAKNSAVMTLTPSTGEILTMVGSKCYQNNNYISNCDELDVEEGTMFDPDVNILDTLQSPGSTNKPLAYYIALNEGIISSASMLPDVPSPSIPGYGNKIPRNSDGGFIGMGDARNVLALSRNIPALYLVEAFGVEKYVETARSFGYTTYNNPNGYGASVVLGGVDVKPVEHAQAFGIFANNGDFVQHEVIKKITDKEGNVIYEHVPERVPTANPAAAYIVSNMLSPIGSGSIAPPKHMRDRHVAGKTGTSESQKDTWFVMYSPDFVTVGWNGNNDNTSMINGAFGSTSAEPWVGTYMDAIAGAFEEKTQFVRPEGIVSAAGRCDDGANCSGSVGLAVAGKVPPGYLQNKKFTVCVDQPNRIARNIDIASGFAIEKEFKYLKSPAAHLQKDVDTFFFGKAEAEGGLPSSECDIERPFDLSKPEGIIISPQPGQSYTGTMEINARAFVGEEKFISKIEFSLGEKGIASAEGDTYSGSVDVSDFKEGIYSFQMVMHDSEKRKSSKSVSVYIGDPNNSKESVSMAVSSRVDTGSSTQVGVTYDGKYANRKADVSLYQVNNATQITTYVGSMREVGDGAYEYNWAPPAAGEYSLYAVYTRSDTSIPTNSSGVVVGAPEAPAEGEESEDN